MNPSLYIHIPFCLKKCPYCSFPVVIGQGQKAAIYLQALSREAQGYQGRVVSTLYVGGGTPSFLDDASIELLSDRVLSCFKRVEKEASFEFNPEHVTLLQAQKLVKLGFTRASLGVQSFNPSYLSWLGRGHKRADGFSAFKVLRQAGFDNISIDIMFGFPAQTRKELDDDIDAVLQLQSEHLSLYALTIDEKTLFHVRRVAVNQEIQADAYRHVKGRLKNAGYHQYEISNFARPGFESRHNINYWQGGDYIGLGVGAHGHLNGERYWNEAVFQKYMVLSKAGESVVAGRERLEPYPKMMECFLFGLRMNAGVDLTALERRFGVRWDKRFCDEIAHLIKDGLLKKDGPHITVTDAGRLVLDAISAKLL